LNKLLQEKALAEAKLLEEKNIKSNVAPTDTLFCSMTNMTLRKVKSFYA
jgi:hypothetical protein